MGKLPNATVNAHTSGVGGMTRAGWEEGKHKQKKTIPPINSGLKSAGGEALCLRLEHAKPTAYKICSPINTLLKPCSLSV